MEDKGQSRLGLGLSDFGKGALVLVPSTSMHLKKGDGIMTSVQSNLVGSILPNMEMRFGSGFLEKHAGSIMSDPKIAIVELVANAWDAGADRAEIALPEEQGELIEIKDNGEGMTADQCARRWLELSYNRVQYQGEEVRFPPGNNVSNRKAFGRNGKGRHGMFCFANKYTIETWRGGKVSVFEVSLTKDNPNKPFDLQLVNQYEKDGHGTLLTAKLVRNRLSIDDARELIGSKFIADPAFHVFVNGVEIELTELENILQTREVAVKPWGEARVHLLDSERGRTGQHNGVAWWVNRRLVGELSWERRGKGARFLDARTKRGRRHTFIVEADFLSDDIEPDWTGFKKSPRSTETIQAVEDFIQEWLEDLTGDTRRARTRTALNTQRQSIQNLPRLGAEHITKFLNDIQIKAPTITQDMLNEATNVLCKLEKARSGRELLSQLAQLSLDDMDQLAGILRDWNVLDAKTVLDELKFRLDLIDNLERLVDDSDTDELHQLQPLFEDGLWIFGPEYETREYTSNQSLSTVVKNLLRSNGEQILENPRLRPDFVVLPNSTIGTYAMDGYDARGEVVGIEKVLVVELKRGGFKIGRSEVSQALRYAEEIYLTSGEGMRIVCFVLGSSLDRSAIKKTSGNDNEITVYPKVYRDVLRQAHARTFNLLKKIESVRKGLEYHPDLESLLSQPTQPRLHISRQ